MNSRLPFPFRVLARPLDARQRARIAEAVRALLRFQRTLRAWPAPGWGADATPFVSLYAGGTLRGCFGSDEGKTGGERLTRAFLRALEDPRHGGVSARERRGLVAQVSYVRAPFAVDAERVLDLLEPGTHGVALARAGAAPVLFLPDVARDGRLGATEMLEGLARKAGLPADGWRACALALFETTSIVVRGEAREDRAGAPEDRAAAWLARRVGADGAVAFGIEPRSRAPAAMGPMPHGRAAVALAGLAAHGGHAQALGRGRARLRRDLEAALAGRAVPGWPEDPALIAGTLALAVLGGIEVTAELQAFAREQRAAIARVPWNAAQVCAALGPRAADSMYRACVADLERQPWAPWTVMAARARGDAAVLARGERGLCAQIRRRGPHEGGVGVTPVPELALTAVTVEALAPSSSAQARAGVARARAFLMRWQLLGEGIPAALDVAMADGAFPISPVCESLRCDVTGHALLALTLADQSCR